MNTTQGSVASFGFGLATMFPSLHARDARGHCTNYTKCKLCHGDMLFDSCSQVCGREHCRLVLTHLALQKSEYRDQFWKRFDAAPRNAGNAGIGLWDLEQMMADATDEEAA
jgi:hypothetical protein